MKKAKVFNRIALAAGLGAMVCAPLAAAPRLTPQQQLDKALAGRVAGKPVRCIDPRWNDSSQIIDKTAIIYGSGKTVYVQRPIGAEHLDDDTILVTQLWGSGRLCDIDTVNMIDRFTGFYRGFVNLNEFVPYTKVAMRD
jgi:hypothetical protein